MVVQRRRLERSAGVDEEDDGDGEGLGLVHWYCGFAGSKPAALVQVYVVPFEANVQPVGG